MNPEHVKQFCSDLKMSERDGRRLIRLSNRAASAQEKEHNERNAPSSDSAIGAVEALAKQYNITVKWPGLYPLFKVDGREISLPG